MVRIEVPLGLCRQSLGQGLSYRSALEFFGRMTEALDRGRGGILRKTRGIKAARAVDFPEGTPKAFRGLITRVRSCDAFKILNLAARGRFVRRDHLGQHKSTVPGNATLFESLFHPRGERDQRTKLGCPMFALLKCQQPGHFPAQSVDLLRR
jgi:hypothetical protein